MNIGDWEDEVNAEDQADGIAESDELDEVGEAHSDPTGFDRKYPPGLQATVAQMEAAFIDGSRRKRAEEDRDEHGIRAEIDRQLPERAARREREAKLPPHLDAGAFYGDEIDDKTAADLRCYLLDGVGVIRSSFSEDQSTSDLGYYVCPLFTVVGDATDPHTGQECLAIQFRGRFKRVRELLIPRALIAEGQAKLAAFLAANGFDIPPGKKLRERMQLLLHNVHGPRVLPIERTGWVRELSEPVFVLPGRIIGEAKKKRLLPTPSAFADLKVGQAGNFSVWQRTVAAPCRGNDRAILCLSLAFTSALAPYAEDIQMPAVHLYGESTGGKSTLGLVFASVAGGKAGDPLGGGYTWNATANSLVQRAASLNHLGMFLDDIGAAGATFEMNKAVYALAGGQERGRLDKSSGQRHASTFSTALLSNGEMSLDEMLRQGARQSATFAGVEVRFVSIHADAGKGLGVFDDTHGKEPADFANDLGTGARENYGWALPLFVERLIELLNDIGKDDVDFKSQLRRTIKRYVRSLDLDPKADDAVRRVAQKFGLIAAAGQLASDLDIVRIPAEEMAAGVRRCFQDWLMSRGGARSKTTATALVNLREYISKNLGRIVPINDANSLPTTVLGYRKGDVIYLTPEAWREVMASAPRAKLIEELDKLGYLIRQTSQASGAKRTNQVVMKVRGLPLRLYAISANILSIDDDGRPPTTQCDPKTDGDETADGDDETIISFQAKRAARTRRASASSTVH